MDDFWKAINDAVEEVEGKEPAVVDNWRWEETSPPKDERGESPHGVEKTLQVDPTEEEAPASAQAASPEEAPAEERTPAPDKTAVVPECRDAAYFTPTAGSFHGVKIVDTPATAIAELVSEATGYHSMAPKPRPEADERSWWARLRKRSSKKKKKNPAPEISQPMCFHYIGNRNISRPLSFQHVGHFGPSCRAGK